MDLKPILIGVIVIVILYLLWQYLFVSSTVLVSFQKANVANRLPGGTLPKSSTGNYSFSVWVYVNDWGVNPNQIKNILSVTTGGISSPKYLFYIALDAVVNNLLIYALPYGEIQTSGNGNLQPPPNASCKVSNFPIQSWVNIGVSVYNRAIDVYMDGKLVRTCPLINVAAPISGTDIVTTGGDNPGGDMIKQYGFSGFIASVTYSSNPISPHEAWDTYSKGYNGSTWGGLLNKYKLQFVFLKDNQQIKSFEI
jgi:hypothetical protein